MDVNALRTWGIAAGSAVVVGALAISLQAPETARAVGPIVEQAEEAAPAAYAVRFQGSGPIARAQALAARGNLGRAERQVRAQLTRQDDFSGLCFDRFGERAAEIVLRTCAAVPMAEQQRWLVRLRAMPAVAYV